MWKRSDRDGLKEEADRGGYELSERKGTREGDEDNAEEDGGDIVDIIIANMSVAITMSVVDLVQSTLSLSP